MVMAAWFDAGACGVCDFARRKSIEGGKPQSGVRGLGCVSNDWLPPYHFNVRDRARLGVTMARPFGHERGFPSRISLNWLGRPARGSHGSAPARWRNALVSPG